MTATLGEKLAELRSETRKGTQIACEFANAVLAYCKHLDEVWLEEETQAYERKLRLGWLGSLVS